MFRWGKTVPVAWSDEQLILLTILPQHGQCPKPLTTRPRRRLNNHQISCHLHSVSKLHKLQRPVILSQWPILPTSGTYDTRDMSLLWFLQIKYHLIELHQIGERSYDAIISASVDVTMALQRTSLNYHQNSNRQYDVHSVSCMCIQFIKSPGNSS